MKRVRLWLRELTLTQQLMAIVILVLSFFTVFLFMFLSPQIESFSENEMFRILHSTQETLVYYLNEYPESSPKIEEQNDTGIIHEIYDLSSGELQAVNSRDFTEAERNAVLSRLNTQTDEVQDYKIAVSEKEQDTSTLLYTAVKLEDGRFLISLMTDSYRLQFKRSLTNGVINLNVVAIAILFFILMIWVTTLIHPLNQIKNYITKIKTDDEPAVLTVNRRDEIGEVADALRDMEDELQKQNKVKEEMIQNISHDLKTPIATIKSYAESIKDGIYPYETLEKSCDVIIEHADRLEKKVHSLIVLNKMGYLMDNGETGDALDMDSVIDKAILSLKVVRPEITFVRNLDEGILFHGDEEPWRIVVENLLDNALRYAKTWIRIDLHEDELCVTNDGPHMSEERLSKLFKPYEKGTDGKFGLGLSIVYRVVTTYGYKVEAENLPEGVRFKVYWEVSRKEMKARIKEKKKENREKEQKENGKGKRGHQNDE